MIRIRKLKKDDYKMIEGIIKKYSLSLEYIQEEIENTLIMIEKEKVIGLSIYKKLQSDTGLIVFMGYDLDFMDNSYRDGFFRSILNAILYNGMHSGVIMTTRENYEFYKTYGFNKINEGDLEELKKFNKNNSKIISGFKVKIEDFFNKPCNA